MRVIPHSVDQFVSYAHKLENRIVTGTVISFDEIYNYPEYRDHEIKAWVEFVNKKNISYDWIVRTDNEHATCLIK